MTVTESITVLLLVTVNSYYFYSKPKYSVIFRTD